jgi:hypothetical protein
MWQVDNFIPHSWQLGTHVGLLWTEPFVHNLNDPYCRSYQGELGKGKNKRFVRHRRNRITFCEWVLGGLHAPWRNGSMCCVASCYHFNSSSNQTWQSRYEWMTSSLHSNLFTCFAASRMNGGWCQYNDSAYFASLFVNRNQSPNRLR